MPDPNRQLEIDALRGIAALMVVFFHLTYGAPVSFQFIWGNGGVDLFFIISGFVIFMSLNRGTSIKRFIVNRFCRLYPTYWACVTLSYILISLYFKLVLKNEELFPFAHYLANLTMFQFYLGVGDFEQPYWTMTIELIFYLIIGTLFYLKATKRILVLGILAAGIVTLYGAITNDTDSSGLFYWIPFLIYLPLFFSGILFYRIYYRQGLMWQNIAALVFSLLCQMSLFEKSGRMVFLKHWEYNLILSLFFILFTLYVSGWLKWIVSRPLKFMGDISYALYLSHQFISLTILMPFFYDYLHINFWISVFCFTLPIIFSVAAFITYKVQVPAERWLKNRWGSRFAPASRRTA
jgi:peptidoglycan/LPS O-acetylase OafA/YrhL